MSDQRPAAIRVCGDGTVRRSAGLARSLGTEHSCGRSTTHDAPAPLTLDRFEAALVFAIEEAARLRREGPSEMLTPDRRTAR